MTMSNESPTIYWNKNTGKNEINVPFMSKENMRDLYRELKDHRISRDDAVIKIWLSDLDDKEKLILAVNIGEYKQLTRVRRWLYLKAGLKVERLIAPIKNKIKKRMDEYEM